MQWREATRQEKGGKTRKKEMNLRSSPEWTRDTLYPTRWIWPAQTRYYMCISGQLSLGTCLSESPVWGLHGCTYIHTNEPTKGQAKE